MTWLSLKSGMASIGARSIAHRPQPAIPIQSITTKNLFRSESSIRRSIIVASPKTHGRIRARPQTEKRRTVSYAEVVSLLTGRIIGPLTPWRGALGYSESCACKSQKKGQELKRHFH